MKPFRDYSLHKKMTMIFAILVLFPCIIISLSVYKYQEQRLRSGYAKQYLEMLRYTEQNISQNMTHIESVIDVFSNSDTVKRILGGYSRKSDIVIDLIFDTGIETTRCQSYLRDYNAEITIISPKEDIVERYNTFVRQSDYSGDDELMDFIDGKGRSCWAHPKTCRAYTYNLYSVNGGTVLPYYQKVYSKIGEYIGVIQCSLQLKAVFSPVRDLIDKGAVMVWIDDVCVLRTDKRSTVVNPKDELVQLPDNCTRLTDGYISNLYKLTIDVPDDMLTAKLTNVFAWIVCVSVFLYILMLLITRVLVKLVLSRLRFAVNTMTMISTEKRYSQIPDMGKDEIGNMIMAFNRLLQRIDCQYEELLQEEKDKRQFQILSLQFQVNPHFLFNSFHWLQLKMEEMNAEPGFCEAIAALSEVYRYNLSSQRFATLEEELKHVNAYVLYMQAVKGNKISLSVNCENRLYFVKLPRFTLQPILENAIKHGIENGNELCVAIDVQIKCDYLIICVNNNGKRIPDDRLAYINNDLLKDVSTDINESVGLKNLALRLRLSYGDSVQISINSNDDITCIRLKIPLIIYRDHDSKEEI